MQRTEIVSKRAARPKQLHGFRINANVVEEVAAAAQLHANRTIQRHTTEALRHPVEELAAPGAQGDLRPLEKPGGGAGFGYVHDGIEVTVDILYRDRKSTRLNSSH